MLFLTPLFLAACGPSGPGTPEDKNQDSTGTESTDTTSTSETTPTEDLDPLSNDSIPPGYAPISPARVIFLGDSITNGTGASQNDLNWVSLIEENADDEWPASTWLDFGDLYGEVPEIIDESRGGATTNSLVNGQMDHIVDAVGDGVTGETVVMMTIAGNDVQNLILNIDETEATIEEITDNLGTVFDFFQDPDLFPDGSFVYLTNVYEPSDGVGQADECFFGLELSDVLESLNLVNDAMRAQAVERGVGFLDLHGHFLGHGFYSEDAENEFHHPDDPSRWFANDCIHPNDRGHHEIRRMFWYAAAGMAFPGDQPEVQ